MKFGKRIHDSKLQNGIENQPNIIKGKSASYEPACKIFRVVTIVQNKNYWVNWIKSGMDIRDTNLENGIVNELAII